MWFTVRNFSDFNGNLCGLQCATFQTLMAIYVVDSAQLFRFLWQIMWFTARNFSDFNGNLCGLQCATFQILMAIHVVFEKFPTHPKLIVPNLQFTQRILQLFVCVINVTKAVRYNDENPKK